MAYIIARTKKLKRHQIAGSASHTARERETPNADTSKENIRFIGSNDPNQRLEELVLAKISEHPQKRKIRTDGVYCVELLLSASPSYFRPECSQDAGYYRQENLDKWLEANHLWLVEEYGDLIVRAELHLDEVTPHIHAYLVPLDNEGQLRSNHHFDGRVKMQKFQNSYYESMKLIGLERGIKGSRAKHVDIKDFYSIVESAKNSEVWQDHTQLQAKASDRDRAASSKKEMEVTAKALAEKIEILEKEIQELKAERATWHQGKLLQDLPIDEVIWHLGLDRNGSDPWKWSGQRREINIGNGEFSDFTINKLASGKGAMNLVLHVNECDDTEAIAWLKERFGNQAERAAIAYIRGKSSEIEIPKLFTPPGNKEDQWYFVHKYLTKEKRLPEALIQRIHEIGLVYADDDKNAVYVMRDWERNVKGAFLEGTRDNFRSYFKGTNRGDSWFYFYLNGQGSDPIQRASICQSPRELLAFATLKKTPDKTLFLVADRRGLPVDILRDIPKLEVTYAEDPSAQEEIKAIKQLLPQVRRVKPRLGINWHEDLLETLSLGRNKQRQRANEVYAHI